MEEYYMKQIQFCMCGHTNSYVHECVCECMRVKLNYVIQYVYILLGLLLLAHLLLPFLPLSLIEIATLSV